MKIYRSQFLCLSPRFFFGFRSSYGFCRKVGLWYDKQDPDLKYSKNQADPLPALRMLEIFANLLCVCSLMTSILSYQVTVPAVTPGNAVGQDLSVYLNVPVLDHTIKLALLKHDRR